MKDTFQMTKLDGALMVILVVALLLAAPVSAQVNVAPDALPFAAHGGYGVGTRELDVPTDDHLFGITMWYPALNPDGAVEETTYSASEFFTTVYEIPVEVNFEVSGHALADAPPDPSGAPYPLVIFSTGLIMHAQSSASLMEHLASLGFVVLAIQHGDEMGDQLWKGVYHRPVEVELAIQTGDTLTASGDFAGMIDTERIAVMGHSSGGWTALVAGGAHFDLSRCADPATEPTMSPWNMNCLQARDQYDALAALYGDSVDSSGMWQPQTDPRVDAVIAFMPGADLWGADYAGVTSVAVPTMIVGATRDDFATLDAVIEPTYQHLGSVDKSLVIFEDGGHGLPVDSCAVQPWLDTDLGAGWLCSEGVWDKDEAASLIRHLVGAFLFDTLNGDAAAHTALLAENVAFDGIRYETTLH